MISSNWLTIIIGYRDREYLRVKCCLQSLQHQLEKDFEVIISDYGSSEINIQPIIQEFPQLNLKIVTTKTKEVWNRSAALNQGLKAARTKFIMTTDIDMLFDPRFFQVAKKLINRDLNKMLLHRLVHNTHPQKTTEEIYQNLLSGEFWNNFYNFVPKNTRLSGGGACQIMLRKNIYELGGFDENLKVWGAEDSDLIERWKQKGWSVQDHAETRLVHMYHKPLSRTLEDIQQIKKNTQRYNLTYKKQLPIIRNGGSWPYYE